MRIDPSVVVFMHKMDVAVDHPICHRSRVRRAVPRVASTYVILVDNQKMSSHSRFSENSGESIFAMSASLGYIGQSSTSR